MLNLKRYIFSDKSKDAFLRLSEVAKKVPFQKIVYSMVNDLGCDPTDAEKAAGALVRNANNAMQMSTDDKDGDEKSTSLKRHKKTKKAAVAESALNLPIYVFGERGIHED